MIKTRSVELAELAADLSQMGGLVETELSEVLDALTRRDLGLARHVIVTDRKVDAFNQTVEDRVLRLLGAQKPAPAELRETISGLKIAHELERAGDMAKNIAKRTIVISQQEPLRAQAGVVRMGRISLGRLSDVLDAYSHRDLEKAVAVWGADDEIDELYNSLFHEILSTMMADPDAVNACTQLAFVSKNLERIGDHATNIAESVHFLLTGEYLDDRRPKGDQTSSTLVAPPGGDEDSA